MKKLNVLLIGAIALSGLAFTACSDSDDDNNANTVKESGSLSEFNTKYNLQLTNIFTSANYKNNGDIDLPTTYTSATDAQALAVANFLETKIFPVLGTTFIMSNLPQIIYVADSVKYSYTKTTYDCPSDWASAADPSKTETSTETTVTNSLYGEVGTSQLTLAASHLNDADQTALIKAWTSLIIERIMSTGNHTTPQSFIDLSENKYDGLFSSDKMKTRYNVYQTSLASLESFIAPYNISDVSPHFSCWWYAGVLNPNRYGYATYTWYTQNDCDMWNSVYSLTGDNAYTVANSIAPWFYCSTWMQDFGDFVSFILYDSPATKAAFYKTVDASTYTSGSNTYNGDSSIMKQKVDLVKTYFSTNFGITLTEPTE
jgi:hypothetical protein